MGRQLFLKQGAGAVKADFDVGNRDAEGWGGFGAVEVFEVAKDEDFAEGWGQGGDGCLEEDAEFLPLEGFGGDLAPVAEEGGGWAALVFGGVERLGAKGGGAADAGAGLVKGDGDEPGAEAGFGAEVAEGAKGFEKGFLGDVFGVGGVFEQGQGHGENGPLVRADEVVVEGGVAGEDGHDEGGFVAGWRAKVMGRCGWDARGRVQVTGGE